ncbi:hypothetical protein [Parvicella tangerina]|uniref:Uncharacterized protein n=1 Tax=Parvicella tangerina TaxID=2829795 RepID=A0A916ND95_9FLAO|nr:hypothetical protein [Parvicella tangerina]CAG5086455.1 hypothetical protein CRYO30217_03126 [Parvicella tangerina]
MKKDIDIPKVEGVGIAIVKENEYEEVDLMAYIINFNNYDLKNVMISSKGYGRQDDRKVKTSSFSHFREELKAQSTEALEPISEEVLGLNNEFFVTYYVDGVIHDKKFVFLPEAIQPENFITIKLLNKEGVLIK